ncbi:hypothetical protein C1T30_11740 [Bacillus sp. MBGLi97]|nr:hypothetical protein A4A37_18165 [Bacillus subtilis]POO82325.1 hypothetical protein C1T30_11740 [Bacillus sp. MBGLi97]
MTFPPQITVEIGQSVLCRKSVFLQFANYQFFFLKINLSSFSMEVNAFSGILTLGFLENSFLFIQGSNGGFLTLFLVTSTFLFLSFILF